MIERNYTKRCKYKGCNKLLRDWNKSGYCGHHLRKNKTDKKGVEKVRTKMFNFKVTKVCKNL